MKAKNFQLMVDAVMKSGMRISYFGDNQKIYTGPGSGKDFNPIADYNDFNRLAFIAGGKACKQAGHYQQHTQSRIRWMQAYVAGAFDAPWENGPCRPAPDFKTNPYEWTGGRVSGRFARHDAEEEERLPPPAPLPPGAYEAKVDRVEHSGTGTIGESIMATLVTIDYSKTEARVLAHMQTEAEEKENETMTISNKELNGMINLMYGAMTIVKVRFKSDYGTGLSSKQYSYKFDGKNIEVGDEVVVESPHNGYVVVVVEEVQFDQVKGIDDEMSLKWVVCKVTDRAYKARCQREQDVKELMRQDFNRMQGQKALDYLRDVLGDDIDIDNYADILKNRRNV